jgi:hypothetical protein
MFAGHAIVGSWVSLTVTLNVQVAVLPETSVTVQSTSVAPMGKTAPEAGEHIVVTGEQLSAALGEG